MFTQVTLENFKTHKNTTINLYPVTLLIGNNGTGKTNLLAGIQYFCNLAMRGSLQNNSRKVITSKDLYPYRYILAKDEEEIGFNIKWQKNNTRVSYTLKIYKDQRFTAEAGCREAILIESEQEGINEEIRNGYDEATDTVGLIKSLESMAESSPTKKIGLDFFKDFFSILEFDFQFSNLQESRTVFSLDDFLASVFSNSADSSEEKKISYNIGIERKYLQNRLRTVKEKDPKTFSLFLSKMQTIDPSFRGVRYDNEKHKLFWEFDLKSQKTIEEFLPEMISDGFMKIAAISLLTSLQSLPALFMLEEIENGIDPGNINQLIYWLWQATSPSRETRSQFILTSHSPSVLREFNDYPDHVYTVRLDKKSRASEIVNLSADLETLLKLGAIEQDRVESYEGIENHEKTIRIPKYKLDELWYSGAIG